MEAERRLYCEGCGATEFDGGDDGFYYCRQCGSQSQDVVETGYADEDILGDGGVPGSGALYSIFHHRSRPHSSTAGPPAPKKSRDEILRSLTQSLAGGGDAKREEEEEGKKKERPYLFDDYPPEPRDFGSGPCPDPEVAATAIRLRYVQGLQVMLQRQCEVMVESFGVSPLVCGLAGTIWLRYVAASRVFDDGWARKVIAQSEEVTGTTASRSWDDEQEDQKSSTNIRAKYKLEPHNSNGQRAIYIFFRALRKMIPVYSSLAICFLVCHIAREAVVPTDIYQWVLEGKLPYLAAFVELDKYLGSPSNVCPLSTRFLFRPTRVIGAWQLESTAGSIAQGIGLRLPSVNFYALACRYLKDLSLSVENLLPHASRLYEWSVPAELWLSSNASRLPTRVCVMAILIVTLRILYNIHGQGTWEMTLSTMDDSLSHCHQLNLNSDEPNLSSAQKFGETMKDDRGTTNSYPVKNLMCTRSSEFNTKELLGILEAAYDNISTRHAADFSMDLPSYLKYCKDIIFAGTMTSYDEETLIERLWEIYNKKEDDNLHDDVRSEAPGLKGKRSRDEVPADTLFNTKKPDEKSDGILYSEEGRFSTEYLGAPVSKRTKNVFVSDSTCSCGNHSKCTNCYATSKNIALEQMKIEMEENGFHYLSPRAQKRTEGYLIYKRKKVNGRLIYVAHADYYILIRAFARLAQVDVRIMHAGVIKLERRLGWTEQRIDSSLSILHDLSGQRNNELRLASG